MMTDNEIIKIFEEHVQDIIRLGLGGKRSKEQEAYINVMGTALDLVNRQKAEIEMLNGSVKSLEELCETKTTLITDANWSLLTARTKAIKAFAERLKDNFPQSDRNNKCPSLYWDDYCYIIDELVEEMVGEG